ncbi:hypothetical protein KGQ20_30700 [Catenulispora sp. NF23]|uniref:hypothetical protein n=1 Tax=Catenulispora pinistramenti TaxID=2705254 RepID=UPI001BA84702|nr:hypothetical protein [Catenulispora pinistramenti]MBS2537135.1 hypothetical protein [Catenulispora pinistramenti]
MTYYTGSGPYCYANSLAMVLGDDAPPPRVIEVLTGSPFGFELIGGTLPLFDPYSWDPDTGLDAAIALLGFGCERSAGGTPEEAEARLRAAAGRGPVLVGPVDMGLLLHQPGTSNADGADHFVTVLQVDDDGTVLFHDPQAHPYATLPIADFLTAWEAKAVAYIDTPYVMRADFVRERAVTTEDALRRSLPDARRWLAGRQDRPVPPGTLGGAAGVEALAAMVERGLEERTRGFLAWFAIQVGARRLDDAARCLETLGLGEAAAIAAGQARAVGGLQHPLVRREDRVLADRLRRLAPSYERLRVTLA